MLRFMFLIMMMTKQNMQYDNLVLQSKVGDIGVCGSVDCSQPCIFSYFCSIVERADIIRQNCTSAQNGIFNWLGGGDREK